MGAVLRPALDSSSDMSCSLNVPRGVGPGFKEVQATQLLIAYLIGYQLGAELKIIFAALIILLLI